MRGLTEGANTKSKQVCYTCSDGCYAGATVYADGTVKLFIQAMVRYLSSSAMLNAWSLQGF